MSTSMSSEQMSLETLLKIYLDTKDKLPDTETAELEIKFGTMQGSKPISKLEYDNVINKLISIGFNVNNIDGLNGENMLRITNEYVDKQTGNIRMSNIRTEINGLTDIQEYCKTNSLMSCLLYTSPSPRDRTRSRMPSSA